MVVGRPILINRLSIHLRFLRASEPAIISALVEDGDPTLCLPLFTWGKIFPFWVSIQCGYFHHDEMPMIHHNVDVILILYTLLWYHNSMLLSDMQEDSEGIIIVRIGRLLGFRFQERYSQQGKSSLIHHDHVCDNRYLIVS